MGKGPTPRASTPLELVHTDVWGPVGTKSFGGKEYYISFIDDCTQMAWISLMSTKDESLSKFKLFLNAIPKDLKVKHLRSDCGGEYINKEFAAYLESQSIHHEPTPAHTPQFNGVAERFNRTMLGMVRAMLFDSGMTKGFWGEALHTALYIHNRLPTSANKGFKSPYELFHGKPAELDHIHHFGCKAWLNIQNAKKLSPHAHEVRYLGPDSTSSYKLWIPESHTVTVSHDVTFPLEGVNAGTTNVKPTSPDEPLLDETEEEEEPSIMDQTTGLDDTFIEEPQANDNDDSVEEPPSTAPESQSDTTTRDQPSASLTPPPPATSTQAIVSIPAGTKWPSISPRKLRPRTAIKPPARFRDEGNITQEEHLLNVVQEYLNISLHDVATPNSYHEAITSPQSDLWHKAMEDEFNSLTSNGTFKLVPRPEGINVITTRWVYKIASGEIDRCKARWVARGYSQIEGVDYDETYSPVLRLECLRLILGYAVLHDLEIEIMDVKTAFLQGELKEEIYVEQPAGFVSHLHPDHVCRLLRSLYGLKQAPLIWNETLDQWLRENDFKPTDGDPCVYYRIRNRRIAFIAVYVDDLTIICHVRDLNGIKRGLHNRFPVTDLGAATSILGVELLRDRAAGTLKLRQRGHILGVLKTFQMIYCNPAVTPMETNLKLIKAATPEENYPYRQAIGKLLYIALASRPDIAYAVSYLSRFSAFYDSTH